MMKMRQQQQSTSFHISKHNALLLPHKRPICSEAFVKESFVDMANYVANEYERDESPVSVISHSATIVSQPSSACTSMDHHFNQLFRNPNRQRIANPSTHQSPLSQSMVTSGASTSEDDSSANYNLPTLFIAVSTEEEEASSQQAQKKVYSMKGSVRKSMTSNKRCSDDKVFTTKGKSPFAAEVDNVTAGSYNSNDDDDYMISIDLRGLQEDPMVPRENFLKNNGNKLIGAEQKQVAGKLSVPLKSYIGESKEEQSKLNRSASVKPAVNLLASKVLNHAEIISNPRAGVALNVRKHEDGLPKKPQKASNTILGLINRQRSINSAKLAVPSKWDDAEKWLCYDNHQVSHQNKVKSSSISRQASLTSNHSTSSGGGRTTSINTQLSCKEGRASPLSGKSINVNDQARECRSDHCSPSSKGKLSVHMAHEYKDNGAHSVLARHSVLQNTIVTPSRGDQDSVSAASSRGNLAFASQGSSSNEVVENGSLAFSYLDTLKCKWSDIPKANTGQKSANGYMSNKETANPHNVFNRHELVRVSVSDGEISQQVNYQQGCIASETSASEKRENGNNIRLSNSKLDALGAPCKCDYVNNGTETVSRANQQSAAAGVCMSDGEVCENYASDQQLKSSASYAKRFKQHQILQKLRRKCSPRQGAYANTPLGKAEEQGRDMASTNECLQKEFVVQTPTHARSASMKDACTEVSPSLSRRDMGTQMTPPASSPVASKCTSPLQNTSPARHNTPTCTSSTSSRQGSDINISRDIDNEMNSRCNDARALALENGHWVKFEHRETPEVQTSERTSDLYSEWSPAYGLEEVNVGSKDGDEEHCAQDEAYSDDSGMKREGALEARAAAWEEAERAKFIAKFKREEARIKAWENLQKAKAEADLKKLEVKLERLRVKATEKVMGRMAAAQKRAEEMRALAEAQQGDQMRKVRDRACNLRRNALFPGGFAVCFARNYMP